MLSDSSHQQFSFQSRRSSVYARDGMAASSQPLATQTGLKVLAQGGNAADAAVAMAAVLSVTEPMSTGPGGDCFVLYYQATSRRVIALNGSGHAPSGLTLERLNAEGFGIDTEDQPLPLTHPHTVTVPGAVAAWFDLNQKFGRLDMSTILEPAVTFAEEGYPVATLTAHYWREELTKLLDGPGGHQLLVDGQAPRAGELVHNPGLAYVLRQLAEHGKEAFYEGEIAERIVTALNAAGSVMTHDDLAAHQSDWPESISTDFNGIRVYECPPNSQGLAVLLALNILSHLDLSSDAPSAKRLHLVIEALRLAFADTRWHVADAAQVDIPIEALLAKDYARSRALSINPNQANLDVRPTLHRPQSDTVYFCIVDNEGNACSFTNSTYSGFGTGIVPEGLGFALQNRGHCFSLDPGHPNVLAPGKRSYHTIIPGLATRATDGVLIAPFGVMGGYMQPQGHVQVLLNLFHDGLDPQSALDKPRFCIEEGNPSGTVALEDGIAEEVMAQLADMGHKVRHVAGFSRSLFGRGQIIKCDPDTGVLCGGSDPRGDGCALGF